MTLICISNFSNNPPPPLQQPRPTGVDHRASLFAFDKAASIFVCSSFAPCIQNSSLLSVEELENPATEATEVVYHLQQFSGKTGWRVNGTRRFGSSQRKISGSNGTSEKVVLFFRMECSKRKYSCSISSKLSLIPVSGLRGRFPVNVTDAYKC